MTRNNRLFEHLVKSGLLGQNELHGVLARHKERGGNFLDVLLDEGHAREGDLARTLASFFRHPLVNLTRVRVHKQALRKATGEFSQRHQILPFGIDPASGDLQVAVSDPSQKAAIDAIRFRNEESIKLYVASRGQLRDAIEFYYFSGSAQAARPVSTPQTSPMVRSQSNSAKLSRGRSQSGLSIRESSVMTQSPSPGDSALGFRRQPRRGPEPSGVSRVPSGRGEQSDFVFGAIGDDPSFMSVNQPGTEDLGPVKVQPPDRPYDSAGNSSASGRGSSNSALGSLNPFSPSSTGLVDTGTNAQVKQLSRRIAKLESALRYEMQVSQALAEILVENGLISSEQLKSRLNRG